MGAVDFEKPESLVFEEFIEKGIACDYGDRCYINGETHR